MLALLLVLGLLVAFGALLLRLTGFSSASRPEPLKPSEASFVPLFVHMGLVLMAGLYLPGPMVAWFQAVARLLGWGAG